MGNRKPTTFDGSKFSPWQILGAANAYYTLSGLFTSTLSRTTAEVERQSLHMDEIAASATNRLLALELYLKALLVGANEVVPMKHDLKALFEALPNDMQQTVTHYFDERSKLDLGHKLSWQLTLYFRLGDDFDHTHVRKKKESVPTGPSLSALLTRNQHGFVVSRYLFQEVTRDNISTFDYEYRRLAILCGVLCEALENSLPDRSPEYKRAFSF
jgi:hypothetical protein